MPVRCCSLSSIALVTYQVVEIDDVAAGLLYYVAQSFLLAGSIFGLDQYIREFICLHKYPDNKPTMQHVANMTYGCLMLLEPRHPTPPLHQNWLLQIKICQHTHGVFGSTNERFFQKSLYIS